LFLARLKKKKKLKLKALLLGLLMVGGIKLIKLMPVFLALIKLKAIKAIILALISLAISVGGSAGSLIQRKLALFQSSPMKHVKTVEVTDCLFSKLFYLRGTLKSLCFFYSNWEIFVHLRYWQNVY
jgi:hypothetical protein